MKLEDNIKKKLETRRITPTASAWDRIEVKLELEQGKKKSKFLLWVGIAASFIAGVFLTAVLFSEGSLIDHNQIVDVPATNEMINNIEMSKVDSEESRTNGQSDQIIVSQEPEEVVEDRKPLSHERNQNINKSNPTKKTTIKTYIPKSISTTNIETAIVAITKENDQAVFQEIEQIKVGSQAVTLEGMAVTENNTMIDAEVDVLLNNARQEINSERMVASFTTLVNANDLLLDVESEVDPDTFKDKIFRAVKKEFIKAVDAVANKDN